MFVHLMLLTCAPTATLAVLQTSTQLQIKLGGYQQRWVSGRNALAEMYVLNMYWSISSASAAAIAYLELIVKAMFSTDRTPCQNC